MLLFLRTEVKLVFFPFSGLPTNSGSERERRDRGALPVDARAAAFQGGPAVQQTCQLRAYEALLAFYWEDVPQANPRRIHHHCY